MAALVDSGCNILGDDNTQHCNSSETGLDGCVELEKELTEDVDNDLQCAHSKAQANRRKKEKKKAKRELEGHMIPSDSPNQLPNEVKATKATDLRSKCGAARAALEQIAMQRKLEDESGARAEEERMHQEKERQRLQEEQAKADEEDARKRSAKKEQFGTKKTTVSRLTKKHKESQLRAAQFRELVLVQNRTCPDVNRVAAKSQEDLVGPGADMVQILTHSDNSIVTAKVAMAHVDTDAETDDGSQTSPSTPDSSEHCCAHRSPIVCVTGHVDAGKTSLLDRIRCTNVQGKEVGGITQQIGATHFPKATLYSQMLKVKDTVDIEVPGLLVIDTPGHATFNNLRQRGTSLCDVAVVVVDIKKGIEPQTTESLKSLRDCDCAFLVALNKVDRLYGWRVTNKPNIQEALSCQEQHVRDEFEALLRKRMLELNELGLNCALAWENTDLATTVSLVPTSASTGDGIPDLLFHILDFSQSLLLDKLKLRDELECSVMEVRSMDRLGTTIDVLLKNGTLQEGERIMVAGLNGPIVTTIKSLLTPESTRGKEKYTSHASISTSCSVRICAQGLDQAVAGTELRKVAMGQMPTEQQLEELRHNVHSIVPTLLDDFKKDSTGIFVKASEAGKLEALLQLLKPIGVPVFEIGLGDVQQKDVRRAAVMKEKRCPEFAVIIAFDVKASPDAKTQALRDGVQLITSANIFELQSQLEQRYAPLQEKDGADDKNLIFPVMLRISRIYRDVLPLTFACAVVDGQLQLGTPLCIPGSQLTPVGRVSAIFRDSECLTTAQCGDRVRVTIEQTEAEKQAIASADFGTGDMLYPLMTRSDIDVFKAAFKDELRREDWKLLNDVKQALRIVRDAQ